MLDRADMSILHKYLTKNLNDQDCINIVSNMIYMSDNTHKLIITDSTVGAFIFTRDNKYLIYSKNNYFVVYDIEIRRNVKTVHAHNKYSSIVSIDISHNNKYIVTSTDLSEVKIWEIDNLWSINSGHLSTYCISNNTMSCYCEFSPNDNYIIINTSTKDIILYNIKTRSKVALNLNGFCRMYSDDLVAVKQNNIFIIQNIKSMEILYYKMIKPSLECLAFNFVDDKLIIYVRNVKLDTKELYCIPMNNFRLRRLKQLKHNNDAQNIMQHLNIYNYCIGDIIYCYSYNKKYLVTKSGATKNNILDIHDLYTLSYFK